MAPNSFRSSSGVKVIRLLTTARNHNSPLHPSIIYPSILPIYHIHSIYMFIHLKMIHTHLYIHICIRLLFFYNICLWCDNVFMTTGRTCLKKTQSKTRALPPRVWVHHAKCCRPPGKIDRVTERLTELLACRTELKTEDWASPIHWYCSHAKNILSNFKYRWLVSWHRCMRWFLIHCTLDPIFQADF